MADKSSKKRKRDGESFPAPKKKVILDAPPPTAKVTSLVSSSFCPPVVATAPGIQLPNSVLFHAYQNGADTKAKKQDKAVNVPELALHSAAHGVMDYRAREADPPGSTPLLNHYVGIYDPSTGEVQFIQAKPMVVRSQVRSKAASLASADIETVVMVGPSCLAVLAGADVDAGSLTRGPLQSTRDRLTDLGQTFGTKKAKKAIRERTINAIESQQQVGGDMPAVMDDATRALLASVGQVTSQMATPEELQAAIAAAKPVPKANLEATRIEDIYDPESIIGADVLHLIPVRDWQEQIRQGQGLSLPVRFAASRVGALAVDDGSLTQLRVLRYLTILIIIYLISKERRGLKYIPTRETLREKLAPMPDAVIENIRRNFSDGGVMRKTHKDLFLTHCCAYALIVSNFELDTYELRQDLMLTDHEMNQYFHEIGVKPRQATDRATKQKRWVAKLALQLDFPKQRLLAGRRRR